MTRIHYIDCTMFQLKENEELTQNILEEKSDVVEIAGWIGIMPISRRGVKRTELCNAEVRWN